MCVCVCGGVCGCTRARARARACVRVYVYVCNLRLLLFLLFIHFISNAILVDFFLVTMYDIIVSVLVCLCLQPFFGNIHPENSGRVFRGKQAAKEYRYLVFRQILTDHFFYREHAWTVTERLDKITNQWTIIL